MTATLAPEVYQDDVALSLARAMTVANKRAADVGVNLRESLIAISQYVIDDICVWRITYSPREYIGRRGGDIIIDVEPNDNSVKRVLKGQ